MILEIILIFALIAFIFKPKPGVLGCGLSGFSGTKDYDGEKIKFLLYWNSQERGRDATGIFTPKSSIVKDNIEAKNFINSPRLTSQIKNDRVLIGHVRAGTVGTNTVNNAHPFEYGDIVLAHNGTLENHLALARMYQLNSSNYNVDSQILAKCIEINFKHDEILRVLEQYEGAAALLFYNKVEDILYCYHDQKRPLFYGFVDKTELYISSIKQSLEAINCEDIEEFKINTLYQIKEGVILSKTNYTPNKKSNFPETILATIKDLYIRIKKNVTKIRCEKDNISGFDTSVVKPHYLKNFWIQCDISGFSNHDTEFLAKQQLLNINSWYSVIGKPNDPKYKDTEYFEVENEKGEKGIICTTSKFNLINFIPQVDKYVIVMKPLTYTKTGNTLADKEEFLLVKKYEYGNQEITVEQPITGKSGTCPIHCIRVARAGEINNYLKEKAKTCEINFNKPIISAEIEQYEEEIEKEKDVLELLKNSQSLKKISPNNIGFYDNLQFSYGTMCNIIGELHYAITGIVTLLNSGMYDDALEDAKDLENEIVQLYNVDTLENFIPMDEIEIIDNDEDENEYIEEIEDDKDII